MLLPTCGAAHVHYSIYNKQGSKMKEFLEFYAIAALFAFLFLSSGEHKMHYDAAFFKALAWPVVVCEYTEPCNQKFFKNNIDNQ